MKNDALKSPVSKISLHGTADETVRFLTEKSLYDVALWKKFVQVFRDQEDGYNLGWRGEYWGKMMRGAAMVYQYSKDEVLYGILTDTVRDLLTVAEPDGRVSSYTRDTELHAWDLWCRKYVLLGLQYYYDVCTDDALKAQIVPFLCGCANAILAVVGDGEGKKKINETSESWGGLNSSSILEPIVRLYSMTGEQKYLDFANHIIENGGSSYANIFELAFENKLHPYQYGVAKAYEMISCFEGLLEYYAVTGIEKYKTTVVNFAKSMIESEVTVIGSLGATHELLDHAKARQTAYTDDVRQETCVTVTWMKFCARLFRFTGETAFADCVEQSYFNAYLGTLNIEDCVNEKYLKDKFLVRLKKEKYVDTFLPFDSYSPLTPETRGWKIGGCQMLPDYTYYGCCACIGAAGIGSYLETVALSDQDGIILNFFETGEISCKFKEKDVVLSVKTDYPVNGTVKIGVRSDLKESFALKLRVPAWCQSVTVSPAVTYYVSNGYLCLTASDNAEFEVLFDMPIREIKPISWDTDLVYTDRSLTTATGYLSGAKEVRHEESDDRYVCLARGPITLAADSRTGKPADSIFTFARNADGTLVCEPSQDTEICNGSTALIRCEFKDENGAPFSLVDYGSAGRDWKTVIAAWLPV